MIDLAVRDAIARVCRSNSTRFSAAALGDMAAAFGDIAGEIAGEIGLCGTGVEGKVSEEGGTVGGTSEYGV